MKINKKSMAVIIWFLIIFLLIIVSIGHGVYEKIMLSNNYSYTIGTTVSSSPTGRKNVFDYKYFVNGKEYYGRETDNGYVIIPNGKYRVKYNKLKPQINKIFLDSMLKEN